MNSEICKKCGKVLSFPKIGETFDHERFCTGFHASPMMIGAPYIEISHLSPTDLDRIRSLVRSELERLVTEQEHKMWELFKQPETRHDGKLDDKDHGRVSYLTLGKITGIVVENDLELDPNYVRFRASQALSLLAWLRQEEQELEKLAKEQEQ